MSYKKHNFQDGEVLHAVQLNEMDNAIADLLYEEISIESFIASPATAEKGSTVNSVTVSWRINKAPFTASIGDIDVALSSSGSYTYTNQNITDSQAYILSVSDERNAHSNVLATLMFVNSVYYGAAAIPETINSSFLLGLSGSVLSSSRNRTITVTPGENQYIWYAVPSSLGTCSFNVGGFEGGFSKVSTFNHTNASGYAESYDVYRSDYANLGSTTVTVS